MLNCWFAFLARKHRRPCQKPRPSQTPSDALMRHYDAARKFQVAGKQEQAVAEYKEFLAEALRRIANASAHMPAILKELPSSSKRRLVFLRTPLTFTSITPHSACSKPSCLKPRHWRRRHCSWPRTTRPPIPCWAESCSIRETTRLPEEHLEKATAAAANFDNGYFLGMTYIKLNDLNRAALLFQEMATGLGDTAQIHLYFARAYRDGDQFDQAIEELKKAIAKDSRLPQVHYFLGLALSGARRRIGISRGRTRVQGRA